MWLILKYDESEIVKWPFDPKNLKVYIEGKNTISIPADFKSFQNSPIFPLIETNDNIPSLDDTTIHFYHFPNAYRVLGRIRDKGSDALKLCVYFSAGLASVILITRDGDLIDEFDQIKSQTEVASEKWEIKSNSIAAPIIPHIKQVVSQTNERRVDLPDYSTLSSVDRSLIDEFVISTQLLLLKMQFFMPAELSKIDSIIDVVKSFVEELNYLVKPAGPVPKSISEFTEEDFKSNKNIQIHRHQITDRIMQINSSLSYVSTQAFSGAIPILERRSLIRRHSLLGVGGAMLALNNIIRFIESSFSQIHIKEIILNWMPTAAPLKGIENLTDHDPRLWGESSINKTSSLNFSKEGGVVNLKLPYFSGRLGFRETEFSIATAMQAITGSANIEWSLLTLTHEMLHGHVREMISYIFFGGEKMNLEEQHRQFYDKFKNKCHSGVAEDSLIESIRNVIFAYCLLTKEHGSLTKQKEFPRKSEPLKVYLGSPNELFEILAHENRNISEIFVHVLDMHYFYASRIEVYIPLIWASWAAIPHINGDLRQYILRSLLTIASKDSDSPTKKNLYDRFNSAVNLLSHLLKKHNTVLKNPIIEKVILELEDKDRLSKFYLGAFKASCLLVDLITKVFISEKIRGHIFQDELARWQENEESEDSIEESFIYDLDNGFNDAAIKSPVAFLLSKMITVLNNELDDARIERETIINFLSLNSNYGHG